MASLQGWGRQTWNSGAWNTFAPVDATGNGLTSSLGSLTLTGDCNITLTGVGTTSTVGTAVGTGGQTLTATGQQITSALGTETVTGSSTHTVTGLGTTASIGDETATGVPQSGWNRGANQDTGEEIGWGDNLWNILTTSYALTGVQGSTATGSPTVNISVAPTITGVSLTSSVNTPGTSIFVTGVSSTSSIGTFSISGDSQLTVVAASEPEMDALTGSVSVTIGKTAFPSGNVITSSLGSLTVVGTSVVTPSGIAITPSLGTETVSGSAPVTATGNGLTSSFGDLFGAGNADVTATGNALTAGLGEETQETSYEAPSVSITSSLGALTITGTSTLTLTGVSATSSTGTLGGIFWNQVDDSNSDISWTEVHKAA